MNLYRTASYCQTRVRVKVLFTEMGVHTMLDLIGHRTTPMSELNACWIPFKHQTVAGIISICAYCHSISCDKALTSDRVWSCVWVLTFQYDRPNLRPLRCRLFKSVLLAIIRYVEAHTYICRLQYWHLSISTRLVSLYHLWPVFKIFAVFVNSLQTIFNRNYW